MADVQTRQHKTYSTGNPRRQTAVPRVDLTPMVDLGFLLITFFVLTHTLQKPVLITGAQPADGISMPVKASGTLNILPAANGIWYTYVGPSTRPSALQKHTDLKSLRETMLQHKQHTDAGYQMFLIRTSDSLRFGSWVDIMDEFALCGIQPGHYADAAAETGDKLLLKNSIY